MAKHSNQHGFRLHKKHDKDLIEELNKYPNEQMDKSDRIKDLLRKGLEYERLQERLKQHGQMSPPSASIYTPYQYQQVPFYYTVPQFTPAQIPPQVPPQAPVQPHESTQPIQQPQGYEVQQPAQPTLVAEPQAQDQPTQKQPVQQAEPQKQVLPKKDKPQIKVSPPKPVTPPPVAATTEMADFDFDLPEVETDDSLDLEPEKPQVSLDLLQQNLLSNFTDDDD